jgi:ferredoxin
MIRPFLIGFATTFKHIFKKPITVNYPDEKVPVFPKWRGKQVLMRDENGLEKCVACGLCAVACPADAIYLEAAENDGTVQAGPRYAKPARSRRSSWARTTSSRSTATRTSSGTRRTCWSRRRRRKRPLPDGRIEELKNEELKNGDLKETTIFRFSAFFNS